MEKKQKKAFYLILLCILVPILLIELAYRQKNSQVEITFAEFDLITSEWLWLGRANSSVNVIYEPSRPSELGQFVVVIDTRVDIQPDDDQLSASIYSLDFNYEVVFLLKDRIIASWKDNYMGSFSIKDKHTLYQSRIFPSLTQPMLEIQSRWGLVNLRISGKYYNSISNEVLSEGEVIMKIFILPPLAKIATATIIFIIFCLWYTS